MAKITKPKNALGDADSVSRYLQLIADYRRKHGDPTDGNGYFSRLWFRGQSDQSRELLPGVYRDAFANRAKKHHGGTPEEKILNLEREMLVDFRGAGAPYFDANNHVEVYFTAQHYGMLTRLLDWTMNPLSALFFAVSGDSSADAEVFIMQPTSLIPKRRNPPLDEGKLWPQILTVRHPYAVYAIGISFSHGEDKKHTPLILPIRPDNQTGRIGQQGSCFTLHMHNAKDCTMGNLGFIRIPAKPKGTMLADLHRLNTNEFSIYNDLDSLSREVRRTWGIV